MKRYGRGSRRRFIADYFKQIHRAFNTNDGITRSRVTPGHCDFYEIGDAGCWTG